MSTSSEKPINTKAIVTAHYR